MRAQASISRVGAYARLVRLDKPIGSLLLLWPTLWALWLAGRGHPDPVVVLIFVLGTILMRSAGCAINDYADRDIDGHVARTRARPLAAGEIRPGEALAVAGTLSVLAFLLILGLNTLTRWLSVGAVLIAAIYPFTKRFFALPQAWLGVAFGFGIPMAYAALLDSVPAQAWALLAANVLWAIAYDTEYAMVDRDDDRRLGIHTSALLFALITLVAVGVAAGAGPFYHVGIVVAAGIALHHYRLIAARTRDGCFRAFRHNNWFGAAVFAGIALDTMV